jgi:hypothetical protein
MALGESGTALPEDQAVRALFQLDGLGGAAAGRLFACAIPPGAPIAIRGCIDILHPRLE